MWNVSVRNSFGGPAEECEVKSKTMGGAILDALVELGFDDSDEGGYVIEISGDSTSPDDPPVPHGPRKPKAKQKP